MLIIMLVLFNSVHIIHVGGIKYSTGKQQPEVTSKPLEAHSLRKYVGYHGTHHESSIRCTLIVRRENHSLDYWIGWINQDRNALR
jgi:hypothetical protein